jgi:bifunctional DNA-binding transcriptional regulator/antitoxin component of YhaV-PrlF toxin-antitoxin module
VVDKAKETNGRQRGVSTVSRKHQITVPAEAMRATGLSAGDRVRARAVGPGKVVLERVESPLERYAGALTGVYEPGELEELRNEWD